MQIADIWLRDMPQQFQGKHNIEVLVKAFSKQLQELDKVFQDINTMTDIYTATGKNLDYVGTIIPLTRKEAGELAGIGVTEPVLLDERYRQYLQYKKLQNTSECTYYEIMEAIEILWDVSKARYYERDNKPATIFIGLPTVGADDEDQAKGKPAIFKPAGVGLFYTSQYVIVVDHSALEKIYFTSIAVHLFFRFFETMLLNGNWLLDGNVSLGQIPICDIDFGITVGTIKANNDFRSLLGTMWFSYALMGYWNRNVCNVKMGITLYSFLEVMGEGSVNILFPVHVGESIKDDTVIVKKDLWHLDGQYSMDGSRILDAEVREERL